MISCPAVLETDAGRGGIWSVWRHWISTMWRKIWRPTSRKSLIRNTTQHGTALLAGTLVRAAFPSSAGCPRRSFHDCGSLINLSSTIVAYRHTDVSRHFFVIWVFGHNLHCGCKECQGLASSLDVAPLLSWARIGRVGHSVRGSPVQRVLNCQSSSQYQFRFV